MMIILKSIKIYGLIWKSIKPTFGLVLIKFLLETLKPKSIGNAGLSEHGIKYYKLFYMIK